MGVTGGLLLVFFVAMDLISLPVYIAYMKYNLGKGVNNPFKVKPEGQGPGQASGAAQAPLVPTQGIAAMVHGSVMTTTHVSQVRSKYLLNFII